MAFCLYFTVIILSFKTACLAPALKSGCQPQIRFFGSRLGELCSKDDDCAKDLNENCFINDFLDPPCKTGVCKCKDRHAVNSRGFCAPYTYRFVGDECSGAENELLPFAAICSNIVKCHPGYLQIGIMCFRNEILKSEPYGTTCKQQKDCSASNDLICDPVTSTCRCLLESMKYDKELDKCVYREYGDPCSSDGECRTRGGNWNGYTYDYGACIGGRCDCSPDGAMKTRVSYYIDDESTRHVVRKIIKTKTICVANDSLVNVKVGDECTTDPVYFSYIVGLPICNKHSICERCPENADLGGFYFSQGKCRVIPNSRKVIND